MNINKNIDLQTKECSKDKIKQKELQKEQKSRDLKDHPHPLSFSSFSYDKTADYFFMFDLWLTSSTSAVQAASYG
jgi:hypothetical protein